MRKLDMNNKELKEMEGNDIVSILQESVCLVEFTKVNGDPRIMKCTLMTDKIPAPVVHPAETRYPQLKKEKDYTKAISVWDMDKNAWRSFRVDLFKSIEKVV